VSCEESGEFGDGGDVNDRVCCRGGDNVDPERGEAVGREGED